MKEFESEVELGAEEASPFDFALRGVAFKAKKRMSARDFGAWTELVSDLSAGVVKGNPFETLSGIIEATLLREYRRPWRKLLDEDFDLPIKFDTLIEIGNAIVENSADRPTQRPSPSGSSDASADEKSTDGSASRVAAASTLSRSTQG